MKVLIHLLAILFCFAQAQAFAAPASVPGWIKSRPLTTSPVQNAVKVPETKQWVSVLAGMQGDWARGIASTADNGVIVVGETESFNAAGRDIWVVRLDSDGKMLWQKKYGWKNDDEPMKLLRASDGSYLIAGRTQSFCQDPDNDGYPCYDLFLLKITESGVVVWKKTSKLHRNLQILDLIETAGGGFAVAGYLREEPPVLDWNLWLLKIDKNGDTQWSKNYSMDGSDGVGGGGALIQTQDGGFAFVGTVARFFQNSAAKRRNIWFLKLTATGTVDWQKAYGGPGDDTPRGLRQTSDLGFIFSADTDWAGDANENGARLIKINYYGDVIWEKSLGRYQTVGPMFSEAGSEVLIGGKTLAANGTFAWLAKMGDAGNAVWQRTYGMPGYDLVFYDAIKTEDGGWAVVASAQPNPITGTLNDEIVVFKLSGSGSLPASCINNNQKLFLGTNPGAPVDLLGWIWLEPSDFEVNPQDMGEAPVVAADNSPSINSPKSTNLMNNSSAATQVQGQQMAITPSAPAGEDTISTASYLCP